MRRLLRSCLRRCGFDIVRYSPPRRSVRTRLLSYFETTTGNYYLPSDAHGDVIANEIKANRVFDPEVVAAAREHTRPGTAVLDVGASFGQMTVLFSRMVGAGGSVYSFEADDWVFEILKKNIQANPGGGRIVPVFGAVHDSPGQTLSFPVQDFERFSSYGSYGIDYAASGEGTAGREVATVTVDSLDIREPVSFMKVDVQGGDLQAMRGARRTIARHRMPILFEYEHRFEEEYGFSFQQYVDFVQEIGYRFAKVVCAQNYLIVPSDDGQK